MKVSTRNMIWLAVALSAVLFLLYNVMGKESKSPAEMFKESYKETSPYLDDIYATIQTNNTKSRGVSPEDTTKVEYRGVMMLAMEAEELEVTRKTNLLTALNYFRQYKWVDARKFLNEYVETYDYPSADYGIAMYYLGKAKLNQGDYAKAADMFNEFLGMEGQDEELIKAAKWDRALCYLNFNTDKAKTLLEDMAGDNTNNFQDDAKGLLAYFQ